MCAPGSPAWRGYKEWPETVSSEASAGLHLARHIERQVDPADGERRFGGQRAAFQLAARFRLTHRLLDLALCRYADLLQELAHAHVECIFVHMNLHYVGVSARPLLLQ